jgi:hypothetical protein
MSASEPLITHRKSLKKAVKTEGDKFSQDKPEGNLFTVQVVAGVKAACTAGRNRNSVFVEERDYQYYLDNLAEWKEELGLKVYSYCLMTNHVHLIVEASEGLGVLNLASGTD